MADNIKTVSTADYDGAIAAADKYIEGLRVGSSDLAAEAFHKDAIMYGFISPPKPDMLAGPIGNLWTFIKNEGSAPHIKTRNDVLAITQTTAVIRIDMEGDASGANYTDFLTLIKMEEEWQVIAKVFHKYG
ncbi:Ff.00g116110.m01.CDS01 [Fusarium sp. VM40]|nr:Ff.00g116110.m01.CDS01 [Fusarium sp. VM40]